jgi:hypothetical protein
VNPAAAERKREILASYRRNRTLRRTAAEFGITFQRVHQLLRRYEERTGERVLTRRGIHQ